MNGYDARDPAHKLGPALAHVALVAVTQVTQNPLSLHGHSLSTQTTMAGVGAATVLRNSVAAACSIRQPAASVKRSRTSSSVTALGTSGTYRHPAMRSRTPEAIACRTSRASAMTIIPVPTRPSTSHHHITSTSHDRTSAVSTSAATPPRK